MPIPDQLEIITAAGAVEFYTLDRAKGITNIGRHPDNDIVIDSPNVPLFHAIVDHRHRPYQVMILGEDAETRLNGRRLAPNVSTVLPPSGTLEVDGHTLILVEGSSTGAVQAAAAPAAGPPPAPAPHATPPPALAPAPVITTPVPAPPAPPPPSPQPRLAVRPVDQPDECIIVELSEREWTIDVEQTAAFTVTLVNGGPIVATFFVGVEWADQPAPAAGEDTPEWVDIIPAQVNLNEGERETVTISLTPPRHPSSRAGAHHLAVAVTSTDYPGRVSRTGATLFINPYYEFGMGELSPKQQTLGGRKPSGEAKFDIANKGNCEATFRLEAVDDERACSFEFRVPGETASLARQVETRLPPEETFAIPVKITPLSRPLIALRKRTHSFTVSATMLEEQITPRSLLGQVKVRPLIGPGLLLLFGLILITLTVLVFRPQIHDFRVEPEVIMAGEPITLSWSASRFCDLRIKKESSGVVPVESREDQMQLYPEENETYQLIAENWLSRLITRLSKEEERSVIVNPVEPFIRVFSSDRDAILADEAITLRWEVLNADEVTLLVNGNPETLLSTEHTSERRVTPTQNPTNYTLQANNRYGTASASLEITVRQPTPTPLPTPFIRQFTAVPLSITEGQTVTLQWVVDGATKVFLSGPNQEYRPSGTTLHAPPATTDYVLTAFYEAGNDMVSARSDPVTVIVNPRPSPTPEPKKPEIEDFRVVPDEVTRGAGRPIQLVWSVAGETTDIKISGPTLDTVSNLSAQGSLPVSADATTFFILTAYNGNLTASQTAELSVLEPPPTPTPTPEPPFIEYFQLQEGTDDVRRLPGDPDDDAIEYEVKVGAEVTLEWSVLGVSNVTLYRDTDEMGTYGPASETRETVDQARRYQLNAQNAGGERFSVIQIRLRAVQRPDPPSNVNGPALPTTPLTITWEYDWNADIVGFWVYRGDPPYAAGDFHKAHQEKLDKNARQWPDTIQPGCGHAYYVTTVYLDEYGNEQETRPSPNIWYSWPCPTPTP